MIATVIKSCYVCGEEKPEHEYYRNRRMTDGLQPLCKVCDKAKRAGNKEARRRQDPRQQLIEGARKRAYTDRIPFSITIDDLFIPTHCPLLGIPLTTDPADIGKPNRPSIDRIVPALGYIRGNVWVVSVRANTIKGQCTLLELRTMARNWQAFEDQRNASDSPY